MCTLVPLSGSTPVYSLASAFNVTVTGNSGTVRPIVQPFGNALTFTFVADANVPGPVTIESGFPGVTWDIVVVGTCTELVLTCTHVACQILIPRMLSSVVTRLRCSSSAPRHPLSRRSTRMAATISPCA